MIISAPHLDEFDLAVVGMVQAKAASLRSLTYTPSRALEKMLIRTSAEAFRAWTKIAPANMNKLIPAFQGDENSSFLSKQTLLAIRRYKETILYITEAIQDHNLEFNLDLLRQLHDKILCPEIDAGIFRNRAVSVVHNDSTIYRGPAAPLLQQLMNEFVESLRPPRMEPSLVSAALAHLNMIKIHPFKHGNGRVARMLQTLITARHGFLGPVLSSIDEWFSKNSDKYYSVLEQTDRGRWRENGSATPWVQFCLKGHYHQISTLIWRIQNYDRIFRRIDILIDKRHLPKQAASSLFDAAGGQVITNSSYRRLSGVNYRAASEDLLRLVKADLLRSSGKQKGRIYEGSPNLQAVRIPCPSSTYKILMRFLRQTGSFVRGISQNTNVLGKTDPRAPATRRSRQIFSTF